jgi:hypothetical protein
MGQAPAQGALRCSPKILRVVVAFNRTLERLLLAPASDLSAAALKLRLARWHLAWELAKGEEAMAVVEGDAFRLAGG